VDDGSGAAAGSAQQLSKRFDKSQQHKSWKAKGAAPVKGEGSGKGGELKSKAQVGGVVPRVLRGASPGLCGGKPSAGKGARRRWGQAEVVLLQGKLRGLCFWIA